MSKYVTFLLCYTMIPLKRFLPFFILIAPFYLSTFACANINLSTLQTQTALNVQATMIKIQSGEETQPTIVAQGIELTNQAQNLHNQETQVAVKSYDLTEAYQRLESVKQFITETTTPSSTEETPVPTATATRIINMKELIFSANILLFEDMAGVYNTTRYIKEALDKLELKYTDTKDMQGEFKKQLLAKAPNGKAWDLIIAADEARSIHNSLKGEFFSLFQDHLEQNGAVILETWNLDTLNDNAANSLLSKCGLAYHGDMYDLRFESQVFYTLQPAHPILNEPNYVSLYSVTNYWDAKGDLGDLLKTTSSGAAAAIFSRKPNPAICSDSQQTCWVTLATCYDGRFIIQTFSTHQYDRASMVLLWQNYIYNALKNHFLKSS